MGLTTSDIVKRRARLCACGKIPVYAKIKGGTIVLACPTVHCDLYLAVKGRTISDAVETWNKEVDLHEQRVGKGHRAEARQDG